MGNEECGMKTKAASAGLHVLHFFTLHSSFRGRERAGVSRKPTADQPGAYRFTGPAIYAIEPALKPVS
jgi:hypothetical protein